jgi:hypothetical protein
MLNLNPVVAFVTALAVLGCSLGLTGGGQPAFASTWSARSSAADAASQFDGAEYYKKADGEKKAKSIDGSLIFSPDAKAVRFVSKGITQLDIPYDSVTSIIYERTAKPRYALGLLVAWPLLFTKSKKHYLTIQYKQSDGQGKFAVVRLDKKNYLMALSTAESQTGIKVERHEEK